MVKGYIYASIPLALEAIALCNEYYNVQSGQNYCMYSVAEINDPIFYFISYDTTLSLVLGEPVNFNITTPNDLS